VTFERPGFVHASKGSSFTSAGRLVSEILGGVDAVQFGYSLSGHHRRLVQDERLGRQGPTPADALEILEARWSAGCTAGPARSVPSPWPSDARSGRGLRRGDALSPARSHRHRRNRRRGGVGALPGDRRGAAAGHPRPLPSARWASVADITSRRRAQLWHLGKTLTGEDRGPWTEVRPGGLRPRPGGGYMDPAADPDPPIGHGPARATQRGGSARLKC